MCRLPHLHQSSQLNNLSAYDADFTDVVLAATKGISDPEVRRSMAQTEADKKYSNRRVSAVFENGVTWTDD